MTKYLKYLKYLLRHKWYVFIECCKMGRPITGIIHDWSKFLPNELVPYANYFYGKDIHKTTFYEPGRHDSFDRAWLRHIHKNKHHWQHWVLREDSSDVKVLEMPHKCRVELLCDWIGAHKAQRNPDTYAQWYNRNQHKMRFHPKTRAWIEKQLL